MKRILQIVNYYHPIIGGIGQVAQDISEALAEESYEEKIICFNADAEAEGIVCRAGETVHEHWGHTELIRCGSIAKIASQSISPVYFSKLKKIMDEFRPEIVIFHYPNPYAAAGLLAYAKRDFRLIVYWHSDVVKQRLLGKLFFRQTLHLIRRADKIVGATKNHVDGSDFSKYFGGKKEILPYAIREAHLVLTDENRRLSEQIREQYKGKILGFFIGRHVPYKGLRHLIEASALLKEDVQIVIAGSGPLTEELKEQARGNNRITFLGTVDDGTARAYLEACDIFCFPSVTRNEGFGLALAEAMYFGKPAVTFTIPRSGVNLVSLNGVTGIESPNGDSAALAAAIDELAGNENLRKTYGTAAREHAITNFSAKSFHNKLLQLLQSL